MDEFNYRVFNLDKNSITGGADDHIRDFIAQSFKGVGATVYSKKYLDDKTEVIKEEKPTIKTRGQLWADYGIEFTHELVK